MAEKDGRRQVVSDPLANNAFSQMPERSLSTMGVRNPGQTSGVPNDPGFGALGQLASVLGDIAEQQQEDWTTEGKLLYMQGAAEDDLRVNANKYTKQGWTALNVADASAKWYSQELADLENGGYRVDPADYNKGLMERRAQFMKDLPEDPAIRKLYVAAFDDYGPRLTAAHTAANNDYNKMQTRQNRQNAFMSGSYTNSDAARVMPGSGPLALSPGKVRPTISYSDEDVDYLALTMLGEAGGEGATGMAAVAHTIVNRAIDGGYGGKTIKEVALAPKQYSTWNTGAGGNNPEKYRGTRAFENARQIAMHVVQGHHVDPTNGATHYYSPDGMADLVRKGHQTNLKPTWWDNVTSKTGSITIGGHMFGGRARGLGGDAQGKGLARLSAPQGASQGRAGELKFRHQGQETIDEGFSGILRDVSSAIGKPLEITSGYRSPDRNKAVNGVKNSFHLQGKAADISMVGMDNNERAALVQNLRARGITRFITYSNSPNMLHVDMGDPGVDREGNALTNRFMHNKSIDYLNDAPQWFKSLAGTPIPPVQQEAVAQTVGEEVEASDDAVETAADLGVDTSDTPSVAQTQTQEFARNQFQLYGAEVGEDLADALATQLQADDDSLWNQVGGVSFLREVGASEAKIRQVQSQLQAYEQRKLNAWNADEFKWQAEQVDAVQQGTKEVSEVLDAIDARHSAKQMTDEQAKSLAGRVLAAHQQAGKAPVTDAQAMRHITEIYRARTMGTIDSEQAQHKIEQVAAVYDMPASQVRGFLTEMWNIEQSDISRAKTAALQAEVKRQEQDSRKARVQEALGQGFGLANLTGVGTITVPDPAKPGTTMEISAVQYGVETLRTRYANEAVEAAKNSPLAMSDPETAMQEANVAAETRLYSDLKRHGVVDEFGAAVLRGALAGNIIGKDANGNLAVNPVALEQADFAIRMIENPDVGDAYIAKMLDDPDARKLLATTRVLMGSRTDIPDAMLRAQQMLNDPNFDFDRKIANSQMFKQNIDREINKMIDGVANVPGFWGTFLRAIPGSPDQFYPEDIQAAKDFNPHVQSEIKRRAQNYFLTDPRQTEQGAVMLAMEDVKNSSTLVGGKIVFGDDKRGTRLDQAMGVSGYGQRAATDVVEHWLVNYGTQVFGESYTKLAPSSAGLQARRFVDNLTLGLTSGQGFNHQPFAPMKHTPRYDIEYDPERGVMGIALIGEKGNVVTDYQYIDVEEMGRNWIEETGGSEDSLIRRWGNKAFEAITSPFN